MYTLQPVLITVAMIGILLAVTLFPWRINYKVRKVETDTPEDQNVYEIVRRQLPFKIQWEKFWGPTTEEDAKKFIANQVPRQQPFEAWSFTPRSLPVAITPKDSDK